MFVGPLRNIDMKKIIASLTAAIAMAAAPIQAQTNLSVDYEQKMAVYWSWTKATWTHEGDAALSGARRQMAARYRETDIPAAVVGEYKKRWQQSPDNRTRLFLWGYADYLLHSSNMRLPSDLELRNALNAAKPPYSYEFMRMRFVAQFTPNQYTMTLAERLVREDPHDSEVLYYLAASTVPFSQEGKRKALGYAQKLIEVNTEQSVGYGVIAYIYYNLWMNSGRKDVAAAQKAVHFYQEYIRRETRSMRAQYVQTAQQTINQLNQFLASSPKAK